MDAKPLGPAPGAALTPRGTLGPVVPVLHPQGRGWCGRVAGSLPSHRPSGLEAAWHPVSGDGLSSPYGRLPDPDMAPHLFSLETSVLAKGWLSWGTCDLEHAL